jgi:hypothetical protein
MITVEYPDAGNETEHDEDAAMTLSDIAAALTGDRMMTRYTGGGSDDFPQPYTRRHASDHDHDHRRHTDLLQGLGHGAARRLQPWLAAQRRCLGRPDGV